MFEKKELRKQFKTLRAGLKNPEADRLIAENALNAFSSGSCFCYVSFGSEVGTEAILQGLKAQGRQVCVPKVVGQEMLSVPLDGALKAGAYGILEPNAGEDFSCALAFVPMLAVDEEGFRLGYGGGYYDRYFEKNPHILKVGLAYEGQRTKQLPHEETDIPLDALVTEQGVRYFRKK